ncbi:hypothetical protein D6855_08535 [Butyrivibrio sp. CB08]|uniref:hypothetical protein n=1 Tax=Butyrivibrio sp. CB08 TaxID=2364879 RepID=UPI000EA8A91A|nr:hypothetical protein [Butyrivibrio sp. CB08]RKM59823.1 hypothetical protein D6855_08535 [Butyrivibrio sp. CB08]
MLKTIRSYFYNFKKYQAPLEKYLFPLILLLYPLVAVNQGLDITDTTYGLSNYEYLPLIDPMWGLSTFLANVVGRAIMKLPFAGTMLGMNIYCSFIISIAALVAYYALQRWMPGWMIFIGEFICESLCWCPRVILYNNLTYLFFTLALVCLLIGMFEWEMQNLFLILAGVCLGLNVMVRFPNIVETGLILVLWFYQAITGDKFIDTVKKSLSCIAGFLLGIILPLLAIIGMYGPSAYFGMISSLFGATEGAQDYTALGMISSILSAYGTTLKEMLMMLPCVAAGIIMFNLLPKRYVLIKKILYIAGLLVLVKYYFSKGIFTRNYQYYDSMFQVAMMFIIIAIVLAVIGSTGVLNGSKQEQTLAFASLMVILITPIGTNNYTFPVVNNLFFVAPVTLWLMRRLMFRLGDADYHFPWQAMVTMVIVVLVIQGALFHAKFAFADGDDGQIRDSRVQIPKAAAMVTTSYNADSLSELYQKLSDEDLLDKKAIFYGGVPGLAYLFDIEPAINTVWPELDTYSVSKFREQLNALPLSESDYPTVIMGPNVNQYATLGEKNDILMDYLTSNDYNKVFESERFVVYTHAQ